MRTSKSISRTFTTINNYQFSEIKTGAYALHPFYLSPKYEQLIYSPYYVKIYK